MAKKKATRRKASNGAPSKASILREVHAADKSLGPSAVARAAAEKLGIKFTPTLVSQASTIMKGKGGGNGKGKGGRGRKKGGVIVTASAHTIGAGRVAIDLAVEFVGQVGGIEEAMALLQMLAAVKARL